MFNGKIKFNPHELAGSFGDLGTDLPLIVGMIQAVNLDSASVFIMFGLMQVAAGLFYGLPMPMQPLKAMAVLVITQKVSGEILFGGGLAIAFTMILLTITGALRDPHRMIDPIAENELVRTLIPKGDRTDSEAIAQTQRRSHRLRGDRCSRKWFD